MPRNKRDKTRISCEDHEIVYIKKIAKEQLAILKILNNNKNQIMGFDTFENAMDSFSGTKLMRICKAVLKFL